jgi:hypothetical protein
MARAGNLSILLLESTLEGGFQTYPPKLALPLAEVEEKQAEK